jgi:hypothetical protein
MIGLLFHGPEVFDAGWGRRVIKVIGGVDRIRCVLAGTMGRTAVIDDGLEGIEFWGKMPGRCLCELAPQVDEVVIVNFAKSEQAAMVFGAMVVERSGVDVPILQIECSVPFFVEWIQGCRPQLIDAIDQMGIPRKEPVGIQPSVWEAGGRVYRRMTSTSVGDFILVDGIMVGRATGSEVVFTCEQGHIVDIRGAEIKRHGIEKLDRFGPLDLHTVKLASTPTIRRTRPTPRTTRTKGHGVAFIDHAGMYVYDLVHDVEGAVTVGDDTTTVVADILYRFQLPIVGIVDGDVDLILQNVHFTPGSVRLTVREDDRFGLKVLKLVFGHEQKVDSSFEEVRDRVIALAGQDLIDRQDW